MGVSRDYYDEVKNWVEAQWQEGVPVLDADINVAQRIRQMWLRRTIAELIGNGSPNEGFKLSGDVTDPTIHAGDIFVTGLRLVLDGEIPASEQPNAPVTFPSGDGIWYLDVELALITNVEDPVLRDSRLPGNVETPIKMWKTDWTLRKEPGTFPPLPSATHIHIGVARETGGVLTDIRNEGIIVAGPETGFQGVEGGRLGSGHKHRDEEIEVDSPDYSGDNLEEVLDEIDTRIEFVESGGAMPAPHAPTHGGAGSDPVDHNDLAAIQGGTAVERFHLEQDPHDAAVAAAGANAGNPFATEADITGVAAKFAPPVQTVQELRDVPPEDSSDKQVRLVEDKGSLYRFDETGTGTDDGDGVIAPSSGTGRWFKMSSAVPDLSTVLAKGNSAGGQAIRNLADPTGAADAATKGYVDAGGGGATKFSELGFEDAPAVGLYADNGASDLKRYGLDLTSRPRGLSPYDFVYYICLHPSFYNILLDTITLFHGIHLGVNLSGEANVEEIRDFYFGVQSNGAAHAALKHTRCFYPDFTGNSVYAAILNLPAMPPGEKWSHAHVRDGGPYLITRGTNIGENKATNPSAAASGLKVDGHTIADMIAALGSGVTDHGVLTGLGDDDHTQYLNATRHNAIDHGARADVMSPSEHTATNHAGLPGIGAVGNAVKTVGTGGDYATLQAAVAAHPGGEVVLMMLPQEHTISATVVVPESTTITGVRSEFFTNNGARINGSSASGTILRLGLRCIVENIAFMYDSTGGANSAIEVNGRASLIRNCSFRSSLTPSSGGPAIRILVNQADTTIDGCESDSPHYGPLVYCENGTSLTRVINCRGSVGGANAVMVIDGVRSVYVSDCLLSGNGGIVLTGLAPSPQSGMVITFDHVHSPSTQTELALNDPQIQVLRMSNCQLGAVTMTSSHAHRNWLSGALGAGVVLTGCTFYGAVDLDSGQIEYPASIQIANCLTGALTLPDSNVADGPYILTGNRIYSCVVAGTSTPVIYTSNVHFVAPTLPAGSVNANNLLIP